ncbi:MAG: hypothetical protein KF878_32175 [Planctomycetes bacterium]|nr:hypothetical protein [Planctomycetota bacterium]
MTPAWRDRGLLGDLSLDDLAGDPPAARAVRALTRRWRPTTRRPRAQLPAGRSTPSAPAGSSAATAAASRWWRRTSACGARRWTCAWLPPAAVDLALVSPSSAATTARRCGVLAQATERGLATVARAATGAAAAAVLVARGRAPDDALAQARTLVAACSRALEPIMPPPGGPRPLARAAKAALAEDAADLRCFVGGYRVGSSRDSSG